MLKNFNTFDQRVRFGYTSTTGTPVEDEVIYQTSISTANAKFHSSDSNYVFLTDERGTLNAANTLIGNTSSAQISINSKLPPDLVVGSGEVLYIENTDPISRSNNQTEVIKIIMTF
jgi:hypothetical protein